MAGKSILLVEDNPEDAELTIRGFRKNNIANPIFVARDGIEALEFLFREQTGDDPEPGSVPSLVLLDLNLPRIDGIQVLRRLRADERTKFIPVVVLTSSDEERDIVESYRLGANSYVRKPVEFSEFAEAARQLGTYWLRLNVASPETRTVRG